ncbi:hypothetical protein HYFRA_00001067 [Hymenoscyphus fraxineus]|uniref:Protein kinase domain-containing protein n=1 Tax=Hymenoscyphus fraxineus TaxID=746836 RepID=A0A9N9KUM5_9HELO|nr:hypothetical protein HYFRA_00001067 [Hymenoscyphus fraxineus]
MAAASPTPMGSSHFGSLVRRPSSRQAPSWKQPSRIQTSRPTAAAENHARTYSMDSSDDEIPVPMVLSALTNALLNDGGPTEAQSPPKPSRRSASPSEEHRFRRSGSIAHERGSGSPGAYPRRVVRLSGGTPSSFRRSGSHQLHSRKNSEQPSAVEAESPVDLETPAPAVRTVRLPATANGSHGSHGSHGSSFRGSSSKLSSRTDSAGRSEREASASQEHPGTVARSQFAASQGSVSRYGSSTIGRRRLGEDAGLQSSLRSRQVTGMLLRGPVRRGKRRTDDEEHSPVEEHGEGLHGSRSSQEPQSQESQLESQSPEPSFTQDAEPNRASLYSSTYRDFASGSPVASSRQDSKDILGSVLKSRSPPPTLDSAERESSDERPPLKPVQQPAQPIFKVPAPRPALPSAHDQENEAPPTFKRNKQEPMIVTEKPIRPESRDSEPVPQQVATSPSRHALAHRSQNTPRRPAPPPPKMSIIDTATRSAGAATTSGAGARRNRVKINGKIFTRLDVVGRGGSARVYRVMAENSAMFALKKVNLEDADESAVMGFKGEIKLLEKLTGDDRVIQLIDYEVNDDKGVLSVLMELGELDLKKMMDIRNKNEPQKFDPSFVRYYWKEMLECIQAIHRHDVVHSDLKPANFVLVKGRLKLIDFGIANAIETDETVNVHRENQIGTPNYMSPESLIDFNATPDHRGHIQSNAPRLMKLGKPSDIWSLGCILYQLTYGRPPFDHIQGMLPRCQAIINKNYAIKYPAMGSGNVPVPPGLIKTMKKCLERNQFKRPTATDLLLESDPFLNPVEIDDDALPITEELLGRILLNVASKIKDHSPTEAELLSLWPQGYFDRLRKNMKEGRPL